MSGTSMTMIRMVLTKHGNAGDVITIGAHEVDFWIYFAQRNGYSIELEQLP